MKSALRPNGDTTDYPKVPSFPLEEEDLGWLNEVLVAQKRCHPLPAHDAIAAAAYRLWEQEGRPHRRHKEHWQRAIEQLRGLCVAINACREKKQSATPRLRIIDEDDLVPTLPTEEAPKRTRRRMSAVYDTPLSP